MKYIPNHDSTEAENKYIHTKYLHSTNIFDKSIQVSGNFGRLITEIMCWYECIFTNESKILKKLFDVTSI